jgi:hypothetical protein
MTIKSQLKIFAAVLAAAIVPTFISAETSLQSFVGTTCLVPIFHTDIMFPPEGGAIIKIGNQMYFVQNYRQECVSIPSNAQIIKTSSGTVTGTDVYNSTTQTGIVQRQATYSCFDPR